MGTFRRPDLITLTGAGIEVDVDPGLGAEIVSVRRPGGENVLASYDWTSPLALRDGTSLGDAELDWLADYQGGWQELFPNAGLATVVDGIPLPYHGEASRSRWEILERSDDRVRLRTGSRLPLVLERTMWLTEDPAALRIEEVVRSEAPMASAFVLGHHPAFLATVGARIDLPAGASLDVDPDYVTDLMDLRPGASGTWPIVPTRDGADMDVGRVPEGRLQRLLYATELGESPFAALRGTHPGLGVAMAWDGATFPCLWYWWEIGGLEYPWYGRARIVAVEPATAMPGDGLAAVRERGAAHELAAGAEHHTWLTLSLFDADERAVTGVDREGRVSR